MSVEVSSIFIYPDSDGPGQELEAVEFTDAGPAGNRAKRHAVHIVSAIDFVTERPKANLVLDISPDGLLDLVGRAVKVGDEVVLDVTVEPEQCSGVYAEVLAVGTVRVGDLVLVEAG